MFKNIPHVKKQNVEIRLELKYLVNVYSSGLSDLIFYH